MGKFAGSGPGYIYCGSGWVRVQKVTRVQPWPVTSGRFASHFSRKYQAANCPPATVICPAWTCPDPLFLSRDIRFQQRHINVFPRRIMSPDSSKSGSWKHPEDTFPGELLPVSGGEISYILFDLCETIRISRRYIDYIVLWVDTLHLLIGGGTARRLVSVDSHFVEILPFSVLPFHDRAFSSATPYLSM